MAGSGATQKQMPPPPSPLPHRFFIIINSQPSLRFATLAWSRKAAIIWGTGMLAWYVQVKLRDIGRRKGRGSPKPNTLTAPVAGRTHRPQSVTRLLYADTDTSITPCFGCRRPATHWIVGTPPTNGAMALTCVSYSAGRSTHYSTSRLRCYPSSVSHTHYDTCTVYISLCPQVQYVWRVV